MFFDPFRHHTGGDERLIFPTIGKIMRAFFKPWKKYPNPASPVPNIGK
jgi:hypothetical protein